jgi:hypothetical protein
VCLLSACISPSPAQMRGIVAALPADRIAIVEVMRGVAGGV